MSVIPPNNDPIHHEHNTNQKNIYSNPLIETGMAHAEKRRAKEQAAGAKILQNKRELEAFSKTQGLIDRAQLPQNEHSYLNRFYEIVKIFVTNLISNQLNNYIYIRNTSTRSLIKHTTKTIQHAANDTIDGVIKVGKFFGKGVVKLAKYFVRAESIIGPGILQNGYEYYKIRQTNNVIKKLQNQEKQTEKKLTIEYNNKLLYIGTNDDDKKNKESIDKNIKNLEEEKSNLIEKRKTLQKEFASKNSLAKTNLITSTIKLGGYVGQLIPNSLPWMPPGISTVTSSFESIRAIHSLYSHHKSYKLMKNEIHLCREFILNSDKEIDRLEKKLDHVDGVDALHTEREIDDLKIKQIIYNKRMTALQSKIKNEWKRSVISEAFSLTLGLIGIAAGIATIVGAAPYIIIPLLAVSVLGSIIKVNNLHICMLVSVATKIYLYFKPTEKIDSNKEIKLRPNRELVPQLKDEKQLVKYLKYILKAEDSQKTHDNLRQILAKKLHIYNNKKEIDPNRLRSILLDKDGEVKTESKQFKKIMDWANGVLV